MQCGYGFFGPRPNPDLYCLPLSLSLGVPFALSVGWLGCVRRRLGASGSSKKSAICKYLAASLGALAINCAAAFRNIGAA